MQSTPGGQGGMSAPVGGMVPSGPDIPGGGGMVPSGPDIPGGGGMVPSGGDISVGGGGMQSVPGGQGGMSVLG